MAAESSPATGVRDAVMPAGPSVGYAGSDHRDDDLLSVAEAARIAHRSIRTLRRAYLAGRMVAHRDGNGRGVTIRYADLLAWLTADVIRPVPAAAVSKLIASVDVRTRSAPVQTGNLELLSAAAAGGRRMTGSPPAR